MKKGTNNRRNSAETCFFNGGQEILICCSVGARLIYTSDAIFRLPIHYPSEDIPEKPEKRKRRWPEPNVVLL